MDLFRVWYGPLPEVVCKLMLLAKGTLFSTFPVVLVGIVVFKFLFVCVWKRMKVIEDDLVSRILIQSAFMIGFFIQLVKTLGPGRPVANIVSLKKNPLKRNL